MNYVIIYLSLIRLNVLSYFKQAILKRRLFNLDILFFDAFLSFNVLFLCRNKNDATTHFSARNDEWYTHKTVNNLRQDCSPEYVI